MGRKNYDRYILIKEFLHHVKFIPYFIVIITVDQKYEDKGSTCSDESEIELDSFERGVQSVTLVRDVVGLGMLLHVRSLLHLLSSLVNQDYSTY